MGTLLQVPEQISAHLPQPASQMPTQPAQVSLLPPAEPAKPAQVSGTSEKFCPDGVTGAHKSTL